ncbi:MAG: hypothetical protein CMH56_14665 [Myxococcales bacterium]|nr:hypothetical protein [Myxococcales bacterium]
MTDDQTKKSNQKRPAGSTPVSASDLANRPPKVHVRDLSPNPSGPAVTLGPNKPAPRRKSLSESQEGTGAITKKKKPVPKRRADGTEPPKKKKKKKKKKRASVSAEGEALEEAPPPPKKIVYADEGKVFRFVGQKGVDNKKQKAQRKKFFVGLFAGVGLFFAIGGYKLATKPPPDKMIKVPEEINSERQLITFTTAALNKRNQLLSSFSFSGIIKEGIGKKDKHFKMMFQKPSFMKVEVPADGQTYIFDGAILSVQDRFERALYNKNLLGVTEAERFLELNDIFAPFMVEGWRAPYLNESPLHLKAEEEPELPMPFGGVGWSIKTPMLDEQLAEMRYMFRKGTADFLYREDLSAKQRVLKSIWVLEEHKDPNLEFAFPKKWEERDAFGEVQRQVELSEIVVNEQIQVPVFDTTTPTGFNLLAGPEGGFKKLADPGKVKL